MTFPLVCYCDAVPRPVAALFKLIHAVALMFVLILCFLGLYEFPYNPEDHAPLINGRRRPPRDAPLPEAVKKRLPPVEFLELSLAQQQQQQKPPTTVARHRRLDGEDDGESSSPSSSGTTEPPATCRVCLEGLAATDEVRRLGNCAHAFHTRCIDGWIDLGEVTCPLCRSHLLPRRRAGLLGRARFG